MEANNNLYDDPLQAIEDSLNENIKGIVTDAPIKSIYKAEAFNVDEALANCLVKIEEELKEPAKCLAILSNGELSTIATLGNFSLLYGKAKSKKSFLAQLCVNAALDQGDPYAFIVSYLPENKRVVVVFDTEQDRYLTQRIAKRAQRAKPNHSGQLLTFSMRGHKASERVQMIERALYTTPNIGLVIIDGIRDLVTSINDEEQSSAITAKLLKWTQDLEIHIIVVLHQNKGDQNARGHLGTELVNKAETSLSTTKDTENDDLTIVQAEYCRDKEFQPFGFFINEDKLPEIDRNWCLKTAKTAKNTAWKPEDFKIERHVAVLSYIWPSQDSEKLRYKEFQEALRSTFFSKFGDTISDTKLEKLVQYYVGQKLVDKEEIHKTLSWYTKGKKVDQEIAEVKREKITSQEDEEDAPF